MVSEADSATSVDLKVNGGRRERRLDEHKTPARAMPETPEIAVDRGLIPVGDYTVVGMENLVGLLLVAET